MLESAPQKPTTPQLESIAPPLCPRARDSAIARSTADATNPRSPPIRAARDCLGIFKFLRTAWSGGSTETIVLVLLAVLAAAHGHADELKGQKTRVAQTAQFEATISEIVDFVRQYGWSANLGDVCAKLEVAHFNPDCRFLQISVQDDNAKGEPKGFNLPITASVEPPYLLIFHLGPLVGEFLIVSTKGDLVASYIRAKGRDYERVSNDEARSAFNRELSYWKTNLWRLIQAKGR